MLTQPAVARVRFGPFEADFRAGQLYKQGRRIRLQDQPLQILALLIDRAGDVVTREELQQKLWPSDTFVDFDHGVNNAINRLREALNDSAENPRYIETLPRRGYRFIGKLEEPAPASEQLSATAPATTAAPRNRKKIWLALSAVGVLALLAVAIALGLPGTKLAGGTTAIHSVAVLPVVNLTGDSGQDYLADGMTDALITELAQVKAWSVRSRTSVQNYKQQKKPLPQIGRELNVDAVLESSLLRTANGFRINVQFIEAASDRHLWAREYNASSSDVAIKEREIVRDLLREFKVQLTPQETARFERPRAVRADAYDLYLRARGRALLEDQEDNREAMRLLEQSVALDPSFAPAHASLAMAYLLHTFHWQRPDRQRDWEAKALAAISRALELEPDLADAYVARGYSLWTLSNHYSHERAARDFKRAIELSPNHAEAHHQLANVYNHVGLLEKGGVESELAAQLDPLNVGARFRVGVNLLYSGKNEQALAAFRDSQRFLPSLWAFQTSFALFQLGRKQEAAERVAEFLKKYPSDIGGNLTGIQALLAADAGNIPQAEAHIRRAVQIGRGYQHFHHTSYILAAAYARMNQPEKALEYLNITANEGFPCYPMFERDPNFDNIRKHPRFVAFLAEQKKQWERFRSTL